VGSDPETDLAVLKIDRSQLPSITLGHSKSLRVGDVVLAIGNPFGVGQTVTMGIVSATGRSQLGVNRIENFIQTDAAINPGNSGGALVNVYGELVGINTVIFSKSGGNQGIGFAIPMDMARGVMRQIIERGTVVRGWLGLEMQDLTPQLAESFGLDDQQGVLVAGVYRHGPAQHAGLQPGDVLLRADDTPIRDANELLNRILATTPGSRIEVEGHRAGGAFRTEIVVGHRPAG
jgi:serine protease DegS